MSATNVCAIKDNGTLYCWGFNNNGQIGDGSTTARFSPTLIALPSGRTAQKVSLGNSFTCVLYDNGTISCWGYNNKGQLGVGDTTSRYAPPAAFESNVVDIGAGDAHACALYGNGTVKCWGVNSNRQSYIEASALTDVLSPTAIAGVTDGALLSVGGTHSCVRTTGNNIKCWGLNGNGQLGNNSTTTPSAVAVSASGTDYAEVSAGNLHTCARKNSGEVLCWGYNTSNQLGDLGTTQRAVPNELVSVRSVSRIIVGPTANHSCVINGTVLNAGELLCWGDPGQFSVFGPVQQLGMNTWVTIQ